MPQVPRGRLRHHRSERTLGTSCLASRTQRGASFVRAQQFEGTGALSLFSLKDCLRKGARLASQQCTQMPKTVPRGHFHRFVYTPASPRLLATTQQPNSVHKRPNPARRGPILPFVYTIAIPRPPTTQAHGPTVYTNTPKRPRGAISTDLCTLLRRRPGGEAHVAGVVTQPPTHTSSQSLYFRIRLRLCLEPSRFRHPTFPKQNRDLDHDSSFADFSPLSLRGEVSVCPSAYRLECSSYAQRA